MNTIYYLLRLRIGIPKACKGLTISGPKQLSKKSTSFGNRVFNQ